MMLNKKIILASLMIMGLSHSAFADNLIFKCKFKNNKQVMLYKDSNEIEYLFGKIGSAPDIELRREISQLDVDMANLSGRYLTNSIIIKNKAYGYRLTTSVDKIADEQVPKSTLTIMKNGKDLTSFQCIKGSEVGALIAIQD